LLTLKGATLLHVAAEFFQVDIAKQLIEAGANIDVRATVDPDGSEDRSHSFTRRHRVTILE
jgi:ankyrin repeat protein